MGLCCMLEAGISEGFSLVITSSWLKFLLVLLTLGNRGCCVLLQISQTKDLN